MEDSEMSLRSSQGRIGMAGFSGAISILSFATCLLGPAAGAVTLPVAMKSDWLGSAVDAIGEMEYQVSAAASGIQAPNRAQDFRTYFRREGIEVVPRRAGEPAWRFSWQSVGWGRGDNLRLFAPVEPDFHGARVEYVRDGLIEWYVNRQDGVEQGFTIGRRPEGERPGLVVLPSQA